MNALKFSLQNGNASEILQLNQGLGRIYEKGEASDHMVFFNPYFYN